MPTTKNWAAKFGEAVKDLREARGWSQETLAAKAGRSQSAIRDVETGGRGGDDYEPHPKTVLGIARAFDDDGIQLLRDVGKPDMADWLETNTEDDPGFRLEDLSPAKRAFVQKALRLLVDLVEEEDI